MSSCTSMLAEEKTKARSAAKALRSDGAMVRVILVIAPARTVEKIAEQCPNGPVTMAGPGAYAWSTMDWKDVLRLPRPAPSELGLATFPAVEQKAWSLEISTQETCTVQGSQGSQGGMKQSARGGTGCGASAACSRCRRRTHLRRIRTEDVPAHCLAVTFASQKTN